MTIDEFVNQLAATIGPWTIEAPFAEGCIGRIRSLTHGRLCCPITACGKSNYPIGYPNDAMRLGLSDDDASIIAVTADGRLGHYQYDVMLREKLEAATVGRFQQDAAA